ncbi:uncharacterized protein LOC110850888 [Folsomia candida]|uniref:uncharacterized protein LOC110850888 n=1 Tax=Folsomia candida TaxID=158441 RepID=UPI000B8FB76C|nr:uncharacterized protein LOC110850888 [Folsomia candida]
MFIVAQALLDTGDFYIFATPELQANFVLVMKCPALLALLLLALYVTPGSCRSKISDVKPKNSAVVILADEETSTPPPPLSLPPTPPPPQDEREEVGRFLVAQVGTIMCYRSWEIDSTVDFHLCYVCFNDTLKHPSNVTSKSDHISQVEGCFNKHISKTEYFTECLPKLRDSSLPNKPYDIFVSEPPFNYPYQNFARCAHGVTYKQEAVKCITDNDVVQGVGDFLTRFACLMNNIVLDSRRFSNANLAELLSSVPQGQRNRTDGAETRESP